MVTPAMSEREIEHAASPGRSKIHYEVRAVLVPLSLDEIGHMPRPARLENRNVSVTIVGKIELIVGLERRDAFSERMTGLARMHDESLSERGMGFELASKHVHERRREVGGCDAGLLALGGYPLGHGICRVKSKPSASAIEEITKSLNLLRARGNVAGIRQQNVCALQRRSVGVVLRDGRTDVFALRKQLKELEASEIEVMEDATAYQVDLNDLDHPELSFSAARDGLSCRDQPREASMDLGLSHKKIVISGATRGIGRAIAELFLAEGASIAFCARKGEEVAEAEAELKKKGTAFGAVCDVRNADAYRGWLSTAVDKLGGADVFIPNVSAGGGMAGEENWRNSFEVDMLGAVRGVETMTPHLEKTKGAIVFISTTAATETFVGPQAYNAIKAAINNYAKNVATQLAPKGVRVNCVSPGPVYFEGGSWAAIEQRAKPFFDATLAQIPMGRMATPADVARAVAFLASPAAAIITGANLIVDGGMVKRVDY